MATGYTVEIEKGITFKEFALKCARAFGANIDMRDEPLKRNIKNYEVSDYYFVRVKESAKDLANFVSRTDASLRKEWQDGYNKSVDSWKHRTQEKKALLRKYEFMLNAASAWVPPTDEHVELKNFMIQQITESIKWDCNISDKPKQTPFEEWKREEEKILRDLCERSKKELVKQTERATKNNDWNAKLIESLR